MAGKPFTFVIGAYGNNDELLPNYLSEKPEIKVDRIRPLNSGQEGIFKYSGTGTQTTNTNASFEAASDLSFSSGQHSYTDAYYSEVGRIEVDFKDTAYLGNEILSNSPLILGDFYPAYFKVEVSELPTLADTCGVFSYLGEAIDFDTDPELTITAYNAEDEITQNYSSSTDTDDNFWNYAPTQTLLSTNLSYIDNSSYPETSTLITAGDTPSITDSDSFDGTGKITITNGSFKYDKVDTDDIAYTPVSPFDASIFLEFDKAFFNVTFVGQGGSETICNKETYASTCEGLTTDEITGTEIRYGRLVLESTYGPETEALNVPIKTEYFQDPQWLVNTDDNCTSIAFSLSAGQILLTAIDDDITGEFDEVESDGMLLMGVAVGNQLTLNAPGAQGQLELSLVPTAIDIEWPSYLNYNWNHTNDEDDKTIDSDDYPKATVSFGLFRGNDRIIHWREVFN
jgi:MSHA biogenesis protein MshQ